MAAATQVKVERAFAAVLEARERSNRLATDDLLGLCDGDPDVHREVQSLLEHLDAAGSTSSGSTVFLDPAELHGSRGPDSALRDDALLRDWGGEAIGQRIDGFTIIGKLGEGGMGVVYVAQQHNPHRTVALKLMRRGLATTATQRRFEREAQILGQLNHPGVAQIYAAGIAEILAGDAVVRTPYIAMELVNGPSILQYVVDRKRGVRLVLPLMIQACDAVQHAHQCGIIHRDLKPANILVAESVASRPSVKVLDFGVARPLADAAEIPSMTQITADGHLVGTLAYMAPEQLKSKQPVDTRADVYSLGVVLYHLLTGRFPIELEDCGIAEAIQRIAEREPAALAGDGAQFDRDLQTILDKALKKDPAQRYQSPGELARDLRLYEAGEPIEAKRDSLLYVMGKRAKRYRALLSLAAITALILLVIAAYAFYQEKQARTARAQLADELSASRIEQGRLIGAGGDMLSAESMLWHEADTHPGSAHAHWALWELYSRFPCVRSIAAHPGAIFCVAWSPDGSLLATGGDDGKTNLFDAASGRLVRSHALPAQRIWSVDFSPDGKQLVSGGETVREVVWDVATGSELARLSGREGTVYRVTWSGDGKLIASAGSDTANGSIRIWDAKSFAPLAMLKFTEAAGNAQEARAVCFDPSSTRLVAGSNSGVIRAWNLRRNEDQNLTCEPQNLSFGEPFNAAIVCVNISPDGKLLAVACADRTTRLFDAVTGKPIGALHAANGTNRFAAFSPDGSQLAISGYWRVDLWDVATRERYRPGGVESIISDSSVCARYSPDGATLASAAPRGAVRLWQVKSDGGQTVIARHGGPVRAVAVGRLGDRIVVGSIGNDRSVSIRAAAAQSAAQPQWTKLFDSVLPSIPRCLTFTPDCSAMLVGCEDAKIYRCELATGAVTSHVSGHDGPLTAIRWSKQDGRIITGGFDGAICVRRFDEKPSNSQLIANNLGEIIGMDLSADGRMLAVNGRATRLRLYSLPERKLVTSPAPTGTAIWWPSFSPDGRWLAGGAWDRSVLVWDVGEFLRSPQSTQIAPATFLHGHSQIVGQTAFNDAGKLMASCSNDGSVKLWDVSPVAGKPGQLPPEPQRNLATLNANAGDAFSIQFLPAPLNDHLAIAYVDGTVRIWNLSAFDDHVRAAGEFQRSQPPKP